MSTLYSGGQPAPQLRYILQRCANTRLAVGIPAVQKKALKLKQEMLQACDELKIIEESARTLPPREALHTTEQLTRRSEFIQARSKILSGLATTAKAAAEAASDLFEESEKASGSLRTSLTSIDDSLHQIKKLVAKDLPANEESAASASLANLMDPLDSMLRTIDALERKAKTEVDLTFFTSTTYMLLAVVPIAGLLSWFGFDSYRMLTEVGMHAGSAAALGWFMLSGAVVAAVSLCLKLDRCWSGPSFWELYGDAPFLKKSKGN